MSHTVRSALIILFCFALAISIQSAVPVWTETDVKLLSSDASGLVVEIQVPNPRIQESQRFNVSGLTIFIDGYSAMAEPGKPALPLRSLTYALPAGAAPTLEILHIEEITERIDTILPAPFFNNQDDSNISTDQTNELYEKDQTVYESNQFYPETNVQFGAVGLMRNLHVQSVLFHPVRYNPKSGEIKRVTKIQFAIHFSAVAQNAAFRPVEIPPAFQTVFSKTVINYEKATLWQTRPSRLDKAPAYFLQEGKEWFKINTTQAGMCTIRGQDLIDAGLQLDDVDSKYVRVFNQGKEIAIRVLDKDDGTIDPDDTIEFYAQAFKSEYTTTNVYWLTVSPQPGTRMQEKDGTPEPSAPSLSFGRHRLHHEIDFFYVTNFPGHTRQEHWFMDSLFAPASQHYQFDLGTIARVGTSDARFVLRMQGFAANLNIEPDHHTVVHLNGEQIFEKWWDGRMSFVDSVQFDPSILKDGLNQIDILGPGDTGNFLDWQIIDFFALDYPRKNHAFRDSLNFFTTRSGWNTVHATGFSSADIHVYDITDPIHPAVIYGSTRSADQLDFSFNGINGSRFLLVSEEHKFHPKIEKDQFSTWRETTNNADYLLIVYDDFVQDVSELASFHEANGLQVSIIKAQDVYDEFGYGLYGKQPIKDFLSYAYQYWANQPTFVLLVGDASWNPRRLRPQLDSYGSGERTDFIPTHLFEADVDNAQATSDSWFACLDGESDVLPDMMLGRLPARSSTDAKNMVNKVLNYATLYQEGDWRNTAAFVADIGEGGYNSFEELSDSYINRYIPENFQADRIYLSELGLPQTKNAIMAAMGQGCLTLNYFGHGAVRLWSKQGIFKGDDVPNLDENINVPFVFTMSCINGYFADPNAKVSSLGEQLVVTQNRGAVAVFTGSGKAFASILQPLAEKLYTTLYTETKPLVGTFTHAGLFQMFSTYPSNSDHVLFYMLFGDPATRLHYDAAGPSKFYAWFSGHVDFRGTKPPEHSQLTASIGGAPQFASSITVDDSAAFGPLYLPADNPETPEKEGGAIGDSVFFNITPPNDSSYVLKPVIPWKPGLNENLALYLTGDRVHDFSVQFFVDHRHVGDTFFDGDPINPASIIYAEIKLDGREMLSDLECLLNNSTLPENNVLQMSPYNPATKSVTLQFSPQQLPDGDYEFVVCPRHTLNVPDENNSFRFSIRSRLALDRVVNYPNPFFDFTRFTFMLENNRSVNISIKIYTIAGRLIKQIDAYADVGYNEIEWDGRDAFGDILANGVYFYKIVAHDDQEKVEVIERLVVMR